MWYLILLYNLRSHSSICHIEAHREAIRLGDGMHHGTCRDQSRYISVNPRGMCHKYNRDYYFLCPYCYETTFLNPHLSRHINPDRSHCVTVVITCDLTLPSYRTRGSNTLITQGNGILGLRPSSCSQNISLCYISWSRNSKRGLLIPIICEHMVIVSDLGMRP